MPWIDDEHYEPDKLTKSGSLHAASVDNAERRSRCNNLPGVGLCFRCSYAFIYRTVRMNEPVIRCENQNGEPRMPPDVVECSKFREVGKLSLAEMALLAKAVGDPEQRKAGFIQKYSLPEATHEMAVESEVDGA